MKNKQKEFEIEIQSVETLVTRNVYRIARGDMEPMIFSLNVRARLDTGETAFFKHAINFERGWDGQDRFDREQTDFVLIEPLEPAVTSAKPKIRTGDRIRVKAGWERKVSSRGSEYVQLSRVRLA